MKNNESWSRRNRRMAVLSLLGLAVLSAGCATRLTPAGKSIRIVHDGAGALAGCTVLAHVTGESPSFLSGGDYGVFYATNDARNRTAAIPDADTLLITGDEARRFGGEVSGMAYACRPRGQEEPGVTGKGPVKEQKCQARGGVWVNDQCVIQIE